MPQITSKHLLEIDLLVDESDDVHGSQEVLDRGGFVESAGPFFLHLPLLSCDSSDFLL